MGVKAESSFFSVQIWELSFVYFPPSEAGFCSPDISRQGALVCISRDSELESSYLSKCNGFLMPQTGGKYLQNTHQLKCLYPKYTRNP